MSARCAHCSASVDDDAVVLCWGCVQSLRRMLSDLPWLRARLNESAYGLAKVARKGGPRVSTGERLPSPAFNDRAAHVLRDLARLSWWADQVEGVDRPGRDPLAAAGYLRGVPGRVARHAWAADALAWLKKWRGEADRLIDLPPDLRYVGRCQAVSVDDDAGECGAALYVEDGWSSVVCPRCGCRWAADELQGRALDRVGAQVRTAGEWWRIFRGLGRDVPRSSFYAMCAKLPQSVGAGGVPVFSHAAVVAALDERDAAEAACKAEGRARRGRPRATRATRTESVDVAA